MSTPLSRREFLLTSSSILAGTGLLLSGCAAPETEIKSDKSALRIAHITDMHIEPNGPGPDGFARALEHLQKLEPKVDVVFNTGDSVFDSLEADEDWTRSQWESFKDVLKQNCSLPVYHAIGNHDVWGYGQNNENITNHPLYGKAMAVEQLGLSNRYYAFDLAGWRFLVLDSTHEPTIPGSEIPYTGKVDEEQFNWLSGEIEKTSADIPVCVLSHIPILCACEFYDGENETSGNWVVPGAWMHIDSRRFRSLFLEHPNVKLCLSGHAHQQEVLEYLGVKYLCDGAICGAWWYGPYLDFPPGYVVIDLFSDGTAQSQFLTYD